jgi:hypothetical protein
MMKLLKFTAAAFPWPVTKAEVAETQTRRAKRKALPSPAPLLREIGTALVIFVAVIASVAAIFK